MAHAAGDAHEYPVYGYHYRLIFPLLDEDGDLVTGGGSDTPDTEVSLDCGTFADCTNEMTEIATASGMYYIDLTGTETTAKCVAVIAKVATATTQTTPMTLYPVRLPVLEAGTAQAGAASSITLATGASAEDDFYNGLFIGTTNDVPAGVDNQLRRCIDYDGGTKVATVDSAWGTNPSSSTTYDILIPEGYSTVAWGGIKAGTATNRGMTALPNAAADAAGGLPISDAGTLDLDAVLDAAITSRLAPTTAGRTLDVTATGAAGIDWGNIENPTTVVDLAGTDINLCDTVTTLTGHTAQTGDTFALANGASGFVAIIADTNELQTDWADGGRLDLILDSRMAEASITTAGGVASAQLADAVAHGGSTATLQLGSAATVPLQITNSGGDAVQIYATGGNGSAIALQRHGTGAAIDARQTGISTDPIFRIADATSGINVTGGAGQKDAVTVFAEGSGIDFNLAGSNPLSAGTLAAINAECDIALTDYDAVVPADLPANFADLSITVTTGLVSVGTIGASVITAASIATDAIGSDELAASAAQKIRDEILPTQNVAFNDLEFLWVAASDHVTPVTGATGTSVTRSIDGGAFGAGTGTLAEVGNGIYSYDASAADMNGGKIMFRFAATGGTPGAPDDKFVYIVTGGGV